MLHAATGFWIVFVEYSTPFYRITWKVWLCPFYEITVANSSYLNDPRFQRLKRSNRRVFKTEVTRLQVDTNWSST